MTRTERGALIDRARAYLAANAAESGADVLIAELADELEALGRDYHLLRDSFTAIDSIVRAPDTINAILHPGT